MASKAKTEPINPSVHNYRYIDNLSLFTTTHVLEDPGCVFHCDELSLYYLCSLGDSCNYCCRCFRHFV